jgi:hypothetical protein
MNKVFTDILNKFAADPSAEFEQSFFQLAYEKLQDKLFNLLPFLVGFEIVQKESDGTKAVGVFGFKSNNGQILFVPAFFVNGTVKGIDIMYSKNNEQFYPLNEDYAELFLKDDATGLGSASKETKKEINQNIQAVDFKDLVRPPRTGKVSFASVIDYVEKNDNTVKKAFLNLLEKDASFLESILRFYPIEEIAKAAAADPELEKEANMFMITSVSVRSKNDDNSDLSINQKENLATNGYLIIDKRDDEDKSKFGLIKYRETFTNPVESGFYTYITRGGMLKYALILTRPQQLSVNFSTDDAIILNLDNGSGYKSKVSNVYTKGKYDVKDFSSVHKMFEEPAEATPSFAETYVLINENLETTIPFKVKANFKDDRGVRRLIVEKAIQIAKPINSYLDTTGPREYVFVFTKKAGDKLSYKGNLIYVPKGFKLLNIDFNAGMMDYNNKPGSLETLYGVLNERSILPMSVTSNGSEYFINVGTAKKKYDNAIAAKIAMVVNIGLDEKLAEELINSIPDNGEKHGTVMLSKTAAVGDYSFNYRDPTPYANELGQPTYDGTGYSEMHQPGDGYQQDPTRIGLGNTQHPEGLDSALKSSKQLAQAGQKQIFDTHSIATLAKYVSPQAKTQAYMPDFISCLDKLGRMLFLVYCETEKFEEMYGRDEMPELVELITSVFKDLGDLVIFLKRKSPELSINMSEDTLSA